MTYNVYCDESCHLENDDINVMSLGAIYCSVDKCLEANSRIVEIKKRNNFLSTREAKWTGVAPSTFNMYIDLVNYFFDNADLKFRCLIVKDKSLLQHERFNQTHDDWYYKMYFEMLKQIFDRAHSYNVYIDIKDRYSHDKAQRLHMISKNNAYDFEGSIIRRIQPIRSHEVQLMQICDILIGAVGYNNRVFHERHKKSSAKMALIDHIKERSGLTLTKTTLYKEEKFNLFAWAPQEVF